MPTKLHAIHRYPVKGLGPETLESAVLDSGGSIPGDRRHALARPEHAQAAGSANWLPKRAFVALDSCPELANVEIRRDTDGCTLALYQRGRQLGAGDPDCASGRIELENAIAKVLGDGHRVMPHLVGHGDSRFTDARQALLSIVCLSSVEDLSDIVKRDVDLRRFRANLVLSGGLPWQEMDWIGETLNIGAVRLRVLEPILRCAATRANPATGEADLDLLRPLARQLGEPVFGVYAEVTTGGSIAAGASVTSPRGSGRLRDRSALGL